MAIKTDLFPTEDTGPTKHYKRLRVLVQISVQQNAAGLDLLGKDPSTVISASRQRYLTWLISYRRQYGIEMLSLRYSPSNLRLSFALQVSELAQQMRKFNETLMSSVCRGKDTAVVRLPFYLQLGGIRWFRFIGVIILCRLVVDILYLTLTI